MTKTPLEILQKYWGHSQFRPLQKEIILKVLNNNDVITLLPTGGGKSLCYQIPSIINEGITIVISPLIALMQDQVSSLREKGIKCLSIPSGIPFKELDHLLDNCIHGNYKLLYLSPERLQQEIVIARIKQMPVSLIAVDEAHCISQWGHDFRPAYLGIHKLRELHRTVPIIAVTATATARVLNDIKKHLKLKEAYTIKSTFYRPNLIYKNEFCEDKYNRLIHHIQQEKSSIIIYVRSRKATTEIAQFLESRDIKTSYYHGGLSKKERSHQYNLWISNTSKVMIGTSAFGMGIDKADVGLVIHNELPDTLENYFQEAGRAGRNGNKATAVLLFNENDQIRLENQFIKVIPTIKKVKEVYKRLTNYLQIAYGEGSQQHYAFNFSDFCKTYKLGANLTYNCFLLLDRNGILSLHKEFSKKASVLFNIKDYALTYYLIKNAQFEAVVKAILRIYGNVYQQVTTIDYSKISLRSNHSVDQVHTILSKLHEDNIIDYEHKSYDSTITFLVPREDDRTINSISSYIEQHRKIKIGQINAVKDYILNRKTCRTSQLLSYFEEENTIRCEACDVCRNTRSVSKSNNTQIKKEILKQLESQAKSSKELSNLSEDETQILSCLKDLLEENKIIITLDNTYKLK